MKVLHTLGGQLKMLPALSRVMYSSGAVHLEKLSVRLLGGMCSQFQYFS